MAKILNPEVLENLEPNTWYVYQIAGEKLQIREAAANAEDAVAKQNSWKRKKATGVKLLQGSSLKERYAVKASKPRTPTSPESKLEKQIKKISKHVVLAELNREYEVHGATAAEGYVIRIIDAELPRLFNDTSTKSAIAEGVVKSFISLASQL